MRASEEIVDGEVTGGSNFGATPTVVNRIPTPAEVAAWQAAQSGSSQTSLAATSVTEQRARALVLFVKVPLLAYLALNNRLPPLARFAVGGLAVWEAIQIAQSTREISNLFPLEG